MDPGFWYIPVGVCLVFALALIGSAVKTQFEFWAWKWSLKRRKKMRWWE